MTNSKRKTRREFPDIYVILGAFILIVAALTWVVPAGSYERDVLPTGREVVVAGSYQRIEQTPVGFMDVMTAVPVGLSEASTVVFLTLLVGGSVGAIRRTGVIDFGIRKLIDFVGGRIELVIPAVMVVFSTIAAFIGVPELSIAYMPIILPLMLGLGYDSVTATAMVVLSTSLGYAFGITSPSTIGVGHMVAELPMYSGAWYRSIYFVVIQVLSIAFVMRYASRVKNDSSQALNKKVDAAIRETMSTDGLNDTDFSGRQKFAAVVTLGLFFSVIFSVLKFGLGFIELSGLFIGMAVTVGSIAGHRLNQICSNLNKSFQEMLTGALIVGMARGVSVVMAEGMILDTVVYYLAGSIAVLPNSLSAVGILLAQTSFNFLVPSGSGQCLLTLPILIPLADLVGLTRQVVVLATHWGDGITNIIFPTSGYFMATLVIGRVRLSTWLKFYMPLFWRILGVAVSGLVIAQVISLGPF